MASESESKKRLFRGGSDKRQPSLSPRYVSRSPPGTDCELQSKKHGSGTLNLNEQVSRNTKASSGSLLNRKTDSDLNSHVYA